MHGLSLGDCSVIPHEIKVSDGPPIRLPYQRIPPHLMPEVQSMLQEMLKQGIIRHSKSSFASLIVVVKKKDGSLRLCVDYKQLNDQTVKDSFPLPRIEQALEALSGATSSLWIQPMDIFRSECIQIRRGRQHFVYPGGLYEFLGMHPDSTGKTAFCVPWGLYEFLGMHPDSMGKTVFCVPWGLYEFLRMPQGLRKSPSTFQQTMEFILWDLNLLKIILYLGRCSHLLSDI